MMSGLLGRTVASGDTIQTVSVFVLQPGGQLSPQAPRDFAPAEIPALVDLTAAATLMECPGGAGSQPPGAPAAARGRPSTRSPNIAVNRWSLDDPREHVYFLPVNEPSLLYINGIWRPSAHPPAPLVDERARFRPAGLGRFAPQSRRPSLRTIPATSDSYTMRPREDPGPPSWSPRAGDGDAEPGALLAPRDARRLPALGGPPLRLVGGAGLPHDAADPRPAALAFDPPCSPFSPAGLRHDPPWLRARPRIEGGRPHSLRPAWYPLDGRRRCGGGRPQVRGRRHLSGPESARRRSASPDRMAAAARDPSWPPSTPPSAYYKTIVYTPLRPLAPPTSPPSATFFAILAATPTLFYDRSARRKSLQRRSGGTWGGDTGRPDLPTFEGISGPVAEGSTHHRRSVLL